MPKSMGEVLSIAHKTKIISSHVINFASDHAATCCISGNILSFVDIIPDTMILRRDDGIAQCEGLFNQWGVRGFR